MAKQNLKEEYQRILELFQEKLNASQGFTGVDKRGQPRLKVISSDIWISTVPEFALVDMSASGLAIRSNHPIKPGELIHISLGSSLSADTEVVACVMEQAPDEYIDGQFRIQCRFIEDMGGMELMVHALQTN